MPVQRNVIEVGTKKVLGKKGTFRPKPLLQPAFGLNHRYECSAHATCPQGLEVICPILAFTDNGAKRCANAVGKSIKEIESEGRKNCFNNPPAMSAQEFVDKLNANAGNPLSQTERDQLIGDLAGGARSRAEILRTIAENPKLVQAEFNRAFVLMQYFGYLRRNPNDAPDGNFDGYNFWLDKLNRFNGDFNQAEMVKAFLSSIEYRRRFGP